MAIEKQKDEEMEFFDTAMLAMNLDKGKNYWYLDSRALIHINKNNINF